MRSKINLRNTFPLRLPLSQLYFLPAVTQGDRNGSVHHPWFLPLLRDRSPSPAPAQGPSHRRLLSMNFSNLNPSHGQQFSTNCSNVAHFHRVQCFRHSLPPARVPHRATSPTRKPAPDVLLSLHVHRSCQEPTEAQIFRRFTASFMHPPPAAGGYLHAMGYRGTAASPCVLSGQVLVVGRSTWVASVRSCQKPPLCQQLQDRAAADQGWANQK